MVNLIEIHPSESLFGPSFGGKKGVTAFYKILYLGQSVGEIEFSLQLNEILSIYIDNSFRGKGIGKNVVMQLFDYHNAKQILAWASKSSISFWKQIASIELENDYFIIEKLN
jgi:predicted acetyltransferase